MNEQKGGKKTGWESRGGELALCTGHGLVKVATSPLSWCSFSQKLGGDPLLLQNLQSQQLQAKPHIRVEVGGWVVPKYQVCYSQNHLTWQLAPLDSMSQRNTAHHSIRPHKSNQTKAEAAREGSGLSGVSVRPRCITSLSLVHSIPWAVTA